MKRKRALLPAAMAAFFIALAITGCAPKKPVANQPPPPPKPPVKFSERLPDCHTPLESYETPGFNCQVPAPPPAPPNETARLKPRPFDRRFALFAAADAAALAADVRTSLSGFARGCVETALLLPARPRPWQSISLAAGEFAAVNAAAWLCNKVAERHPVCSFMQGMDAAVHGMAAWHNAGVRC